jgi:hypothetical protein
LLGERHVARLKHDLTYEDFIDWVAYLEVKEESRSKLDHYMVALRHDVHVLIDAVRGLFVSTTGPTPVERLFLTGRSAEEADADEFKVPEGYEYDETDPVKGDFDKGYGLPGIEVGKEPLDEKWQKVNDREKQKWETLAKITGGLIQMLPPEEVKADG